MTDDDIIKSMNCCTGSCNCCTECPAKAYNVECGNVLKFNALNLIMRQKAEINRLKNEIHEQGGKDNG